MLDFQSVFSRLRGCYSCSDLEENILKTIRYGFRAVQVDNLLLIPKSTAIMYI